LTGAPFHRRRSTEAGKSAVTGGRRAIVAASVGNLLEWFDFSVYALFAIYIGGNFFPKGHPGADLVKALLVFGLGFVIRPLGSVLIGMYGDRAGRKSALTATVLLMGCGTLIIALAPSYAAIGVGAPLLLLIGRLLQGFSAGGEIGSAAAFLVEHAPAAKRGRFTAWLQASMGMANILGALLAFTLTALLPADALIEWGWRVPFLIGLSIVPLGWYLRRTLAETPAFAAERGTSAALPFIEVFRENSTSVLCGFGICILWAVAVYVLLIFMPVFVQSAFGFSARQAFSASLIENILFVSGCCAFGAVADRVGYERMLGIGAISLLSGVPPLLLWLAAYPSALVLICVLAAFGVLVASFTSVAPLALAGLFPTRLRATGISITYNGAFTIFGGFAPAILTWFTASAAGSVFAPAWYVAAAAVPTLVALAYLRRATPVEPARRRAELPAREST
jgi:MHS family proline/betaine transporter-like MFS transporter